MLLSGMWLRLTSDVGGAGDRARREFERGKDVSRPPGRPFTLHDAVDVGAGVGGEGETGPAVTSGTCVNPMSDREPDIVPPVSSAPSPRSRSERKVFNKLLTSMSDAGPMTAVLATWADSQRSGFVVSGRLDVLMSDFVAEFWAATTLKT